MISEFCQRRRESITMIMDILSGFINASKMLSAIGDSPILFITINIDYHPPLSVGAETCDVTTGGAA